MKDYYHTFHIPVMGTGHSVDTPIRVAPLGITSVISLVDDILLEKTRKYYNDETGEIKKKIILKVSDFRSALIQGRFLAKKGLEVYEFRLESGLNCGGHTFPCNGNLLPYHLQDFKEKRELLTAELQPLIQRYYKSMGWKYPEPVSNSRPLITVQGGIGTNGEVRRLTEDFSIDLTGWASPFLLVPEATCFAPSGILVFV